VRSGRRLGLLTVPLLLGVLPVLAPATASAADAPPCEPGVTRYVRQSAYAITSLSIPQTWPIAQGAGQVVAVVDSGVDDANAHFPAGSVLPGKSFVPGSPHEDLIGHGTAVAGIIAARPVAGSALIGPARAARILPVRVFADEDPTGQRQVAFPPDTSRMAEGIRWAAANGADVINVSMSTFPSDRHLPELKSALAFAHSKDVVVVASGGNPGAGEQRPVTSPRWPAAGDHVIGVAATNAAGGVDEWSVHGPQNDVAAPGANVLATFHANGDCLYGQEHAYTSFAAPFVSGLAAQLRQKFPHETADQIGYRIMASADRPRMGQRDDVAGWGEIRPYQALTMSLDPNRLGPPLPGAKRPARPATDETSVSPVAAQSDPLAPVRSQVMWAALVAVGLCALALVLRPLARGARRGNADE
jgi:type VII secretion-associated serine protease mycosin